MVPIQITDYAPSAIKLLAYTFQNKANIAAFMHAFSNGAQEIENAIFDLLNFRYLETAYGVQLDQIGVIVGEDRQGRDDDDYLVALKTRILINQAQGDPITILDVTTLLTESTYIRMTEVFPAKVYLQTNGPVIPPNLYSTLLEVIGEGIGLILTISPEGIPFAFDNAPNTAGFGAIGFPDYGGHFVGLLGPI